MRVMIRVVKGRALGVLMCLLAVLSWVAAAGASSIPEVTSSPRYVLQVQGGGEWTFAELLSLRRASSHRLASVTLQGPVTPAWSSLFSWYETEKEGQPGAQMTATLEVYRSAAAAKPVITYTLTRARPVSVSVTGGTATPIGTVRIRATSIVVASSRRSPRRG